MPLLEALLMPEKAWRAAELLVPSSRETADVLHACGSEGGGDEGRQFR